MSGCLYTNPDPVFCLIRCSLVQCCGIQRTCMNYYGLRCVHRLFSLSQAINAKYLAWLLAESGSESLCFDRDTTKALNM